MLCESCSSCIGSIVVASCSPQGRILAQFAIFVDACVWFLSTGVSCALDEDKLGLFCRGCIGEQWSPGGFQSTSLSADTRRCAQGALHASVGLKARKARPDGGFGAAQPHRSSA